MRFVPYATRPSGITSPDWPEIANHPDVVRWFQRILIGHGFDVGPQGANGVYNQTTADAVRRFQIAYNAQPASQRHNPTSLTVNGQLDTPTQTVLGREWQRAVNVGTSPTVDGIPVTPIDAHWGHSFLDPTVTLGTTTQTATSPWTVVAGVTAVIGVSLAVANYYQNRRSARR